MADRLSPDQSDTKRTLNLMKVSSFYYDQAKLFLMKCLYSRETQSWGRIISLGISKWHRPQIFLHTVLLKAFGRLAGRWYLKQSFVEASADNLHRINPIRHFSLAVVVIARSRLSESLFFFILCLSMSYKILCPQITGSCSVILCAKKSAWPKQTPHSMFPFTPLNSRRQTYPLAPTPSRRFLHRGCQCYIRRGPAVDVDAVCRLRYCKINTLHMLNQICSFTFQSVCTLPHSTE